MTTTDAAGGKPINMKRVVMTSLAASSIEWYDFFIYGTAAALVFPKLFFAPSLGPSVAQLAAFSTFAVGFFARPVGGIIFGHFGDKFGRKKALVTAMLIMGLATTAVGLLPSYQSIGIAAPWILVALRFLQGLAVGGQWGGAALLAIENAPVQKRGFYGSFAQMGVPAGLITANLIFLIMGKLVAPDAFQAWGWRIPFLMSILLVGLSLYVQLVLEDTAEFKALEQAEDKIERKKAASPVISAIVKHPVKVLLAAGSFVAGNGTFYIMTVYAVSYWTGQLHLPKTTVLWAVMLGSLISAPVLTITATLSDRFGRRGIFLVGAAAQLIWAWPFFMLLNLGQFWPAVLAMAGGLIANSIMYGLTAAMMTEMFDTEFRYSGASLGYQLGAICGGGFATLIAVSLVTRYHTAMAVSVYMAILCAISFLSVLVLSETHKKVNRTPAKVK